MAARSPTEMYRARRERRGRLRLWAALALALLLHVAVAGLWALFYRESAPSQRDIQARPVTLRPLTEQQWSKNRGPIADRTPLRPTAPRPVAPPPPQRPKGQVVDVAPGNGEQDPNSKYLAESSNRTEKETRAKEQTPNYRNAMPKRTSSNPQTGVGQESVARGGNDGLGSDNRPRKSGGQRGAMEMPSSQKRQELALRLDPKLFGPGPSVSNHPESERNEGNSSRLNLKPGEVGKEPAESSPGRAGPKGPINLSPSASVLDRLNGAAPNDHLDAEEGEGTFLNTREWKYASFFNRVKQSVAMHWDPGAQLRQRDPSGEIYGGRDRYTLLQVVLDARGSLTDVQVEKSSGLDFLDQEAVASFRKAQPFPNPPPGLLGGDSTVKFSFGFFLELGSGTRMRLFRGSSYQ